MSYTIIIKNESEVWSQTQILIKLQQLARATKSTYFIRYDLSLEPTSLLSIIFWKCLFFLPSFRNWMFEIDLECARNILIQLKPLSTLNPFLQTAFKNAICNFKNIFPNHSLNL
jgi:hypothetical protein